MTRHGAPWLGIVLVVAGVVVLAIAAFAPPPATGTADDGWSRGMGPGGPVMGAGPGALGDQAPGPGASGFVAGTATSPRVVRILATPQLRFIPDAVAVKQGETVTFQVTAMGPVPHEFMVGPAADVAADKPGTPEISDLGMMGTRSLTYTFSGPGPYAYACHEPGHYEAGMTGTIAIVP